MGAVYQATDTQTGQLTAVKEMSNSAARDRVEKEQAIIHFKREADILQRLRHPNIPKVSDTFSIGDKYFLVMEFVDGRTLEQMLDNGEAPFPEQQVSNWAMQLCDALAYLHTQEQAIIFRDLKPGNIMIDPIGNVKLIDFGIVRFFKHGQAKDTTMLGTQGYASPEQHGTGQTDARSDIYSLGATLYCLLTGKEPEIYPLPPVRQLSPNISPQMESLILRATQLSASDRFPTMHALRNALSSSFLSGEATQVVQNRGEGQINRRRSPVKTSRLTTNMLLAASHWPTERLVAAGGGMLLLILLAAWFITPSISGTWFWLNVPTITIVAPFAYAATRKRGAAAVSHIAVAVIGAALTWYRADLVGNYAGLLLGAFLSAALIEGMIALLPKIMGTLEREDHGAWQREMIWLGITAVIGHILLASIATSLTFALNPIAWLFAFTLGSLGWFLGDMIQGYLYLKQAGIKWR